MTQHNMMGCISTLDEFSSKERLIAELGAMRFSCSNAIEMNLILKDLLRKIAYPKLGTKEMNMSRDEFAKIISSKFSLEDLS